jgi:hypothetical protein
MNPLSALRSDRKLVDVTGIEPVTPCLQRRATQETDDLAGDGLNEREIAKVTTIKDY